jgi:hypothetical protein
MTEISNTRKQEIYKRWEELKRARLSDVEAASALCAEFSVDSATLQSIMQEQEKDEQPGD